MKKDDSMMYIYNIDKLQGKKKISIEQQQAATKYQVSETFKRCRKERKLTQVEMSELTGIQQPNITRFESKNCNPTLEMMVKMAAAMGKTVHITLE